jgi:hypothetical protein
MASTNVAWSAYGILVPIHVTMKIFNLNPKKFIPFLFILSLDVK